MKNGLLRSANKWKLVFLPMALFMLGIPMTSCVNAPTETPIPSEVRYALTIEYLNLLHATAVGPSYGLMEWTPTATFIATPSLESSTPPATLTNTPLETPCYRARVLRESPEPYFGQLSPGEHFVKTWTLLNTGACKWPAAVQLVYVRVEHNQTADILDQMSGPDAQPIGMEVPVGGTIDLSLALIAPPEFGQYAGYWMLRNTAGGRFGEGVRGEAAFSVTILIHLQKTSATVPAATQTPTWTPTSTQTTVPPTETGIPPTIAPTTEPTAESPTLPPDETQSDTPTGG
jgi:hypothetical protein